MNLLGAHLIAFAAGYILDLIIGDPLWMPHPIRLIGRLIGWLDRSLMDREAVRPKTERKPGGELARGVVMWIIVMSMTVAMTGALIIGAYMLHMICGITAETILTCYILAGRSLYKESMKAYDALQTGSIEDARYAVSMIVGRDTDCLDEAGITRAAVETVAENTSDGVIAPMIYLCIGGPVLGMAYKAINTMDSMVGYRNDRYEYFGRAAARIDDVVNLIPARISALLMIIAAAVMGRDYSARRAWRVFIRDRKLSTSPNSGQTETVCAGALGIRLLGDTQYFGRIVHKPYIGDDTRPVETEDIRRANRLMTATGLLCMVLCAGIYAGIYAVVMK